MELITWSIHMNNETGEKKTQITIDTDLNVTDTKPDIDRLIASDKSLVIDSVRVSGGRVNIRGRLQYKMLYGSSQSDGKIISVTGDIPVDEFINMDGVDDDGHVTIKYSFDDFQINIINSRKYGVKAIIEFTIKADVEADIELPVDIDDEAVEKKWENTEFLELFFCGKDNYRIKQEIAIPKGKPNINELIYDSTCITGMNIRPVNDGIQLEGQLCVFTMYESMEDGTPVEWLENIIPFSGRIDIPDATDNMIARVVRTFENCDIQVKNDDDNEPRILTVDYAVNLNISLYQEKNKNMISDAYSTRCQLIPEYTDIEMRTLLMKNWSRTKVIEKIEIDQNDSVLSICSSMSELKVDDVSIREDSIVVYGIITVNIICITSNDKYPAMSLIRVIPFEHTIEIPEVTRETECDIQSYIESIFVNMTGTDELEVKTVVAFDVTAINTKKKKIMSSISEKPYEQEKENTKPGIIGYIVGSDDDLWNIAKENNTTMEIIADTNNLASLEVVPGDKLIIINS